jgi:hypothetical protein
LRLIQRPSVFRLARFKSVHPLLSITALRFHRGAPTRQTESGRFWNPRRSQKGAKSEYLFNTGPAHSLSPEGATAQLQKPSVFRLARFNSYFFAAGIVEQFVAFKFKTRQTESGRCNNSNKAKNAPEAQQHG